MNLQQLKYVRETIRCDFNLTTAAAVLFTSQPGLSKAIRELEEELGAVIFKRQAKRLIGLTEEGKEIAKVVDRLLTEADNLKRIAVEMNTGDQGELRIAATHTQARYTLPKAIVAVRKRYPKVAIIIKQGTPTQIVQMLKNDEVDLGVATESLSKDQSLEAKRLFSWRHVAIVPLDHPLANDANVTLIELAKYDIVTYDKEFAGRTRIDAAFEAHQLKLKVVLEATDSDVIKTYVGLGLGVGIVSELAMVEDSNSQGRTKNKAVFASLKIKPSIASNDTFVAYRKARILKRFEVAVIEALVG